MSEKLTAEEYSESEMFLKSILNSQIAIAMTPSDLAIYKNLVAKEAVEKFAIQLIEKLEADDRPISFLMNIKSIAKQHGVEL